MKSSSLMNFIVRNRQITLFTFITYLAVLWVILLNSAEFSSREMQVFLAYTGIVFIIQLLIIAALLWLRRLLKKMDWLASLAAAFFTAFNIYSLIFVHNPRFTNLSEPLWAVFIAVLFIVCSLPFFISSRNFVKFNHTFAAFMAVIIGLQFLGDDHFSVKGLLDKIPEHIKFVEFERKPNVYIVSLDSLAPEAVVRKNIRLEKIPYIEELRRQKARIIPNSFAERIPTKRSLNIILAMDKNYMDTVSEDAGFVRNQVPNPAYEIFRRNGYKIQVMYRTRYFGDDKGRLDYYGIAESYGICEHVEKNYSFMGYCLKPVQERLRSFSSIHQHEYPQMLFDRIRETARSGEPWFTYASIYTPGHAKNSTQYDKPEDWDEYREKFKKRSQEAAEVISEMFRVIKENDPDSITIIFGDHGALLTKGAVDDYNGLAADILEVKDKFKDDGLVSFEQSVQDRHAILIALMPGDACTGYFTQNPYSSIRLIRDLATCLSGGQDPMPPDIQPDGQRWAPYIYD